jgi:putative ABC transport system permease protein
LRRMTEVPAVAIAVPDRITESPPALDSRLPGLADDAAAWRLVLRDPSYLLVDLLYAAPGGPQGEPLRAGRRITLTDPGTGRQVSRTVAGVLRHGDAFYGIGGGEFRYPVFVSRTALGAQFGAAARPSSLLVRLAPGTDPAAVSTQLQGRFLARGLVATDIAQAVRTNFTGSRQFFTLMRGYLALGLFVGVAGLGVVMVKSVRERRRTIAVLRALGFQARTVRRAVMGESAFVAVEGVTIGAVLGILTTWLLYQNSPAFGTLTATFPVAWTEITLTAGATLVASLLATVGPARRAARIKPALALRIAD